MSVSESVLAAMRQTIDVFCDEVAGDRSIAALDRVYTVGARILPPGSEPISGREGIKAFWKGAIEGLNVKRVTMESTEVNAVGQALSEIGRATIFTQDGSIDVKYLVLWKQEEGAWKWDIDIWN